MSSYDRNRKRAAQRAAERNAARAAGKTGVVPGVGYVSPRKERETYVDSAGTTRHKSGAKMESTEDSLRDRRMERGGVDGNTRYDRAPKAPNTKKFGTGKTALQKDMEKKHGKGKSAMDIVRAEIRAKHGKGAVMDTKKK